jgi:hypothetical protein
LEEVARILVLDQKEDEDTKNKKISRIQMGM